MEEKVKPATDAEIAARHTRGKSENEYWTFQQQLVERIKQEARSKAGLVEAAEWVLEHSLLYRVAGWEKLQAAVAVAKGESPQ